MQDMILPEAPSATRSQAGLAGVLVPLLAIWFAATPTQAAEPLPPAQDIVSQVRAMPGVCVQLGCPDVTLPVQLAEGGLRLVHVLEADENKVQAAREAWLARGVYGQVSVEQWSAPSLPYEDNLINVVIAADPFLAPEREIMRVLAPNGVAWIRQGQVWRTFRKPWPKDYDEWTHWRHGADGNMVSHDAAAGLPTGLRWVAGPAQDAGGKKWYYDHVLVSAQGRNYYLNEEGIIARDSFNGTLLWKRPLKASTFKETGTEVPALLKLITKLGTRTSKVRPVAVGDRLYVAAEGKLTALDAATGRTVVEFGPLTHPRELLVEADTLLASDTNGVRAFSAGSGKLLWETGLAAKRIVAGDKRVYCLSDALLVSLDLATGREQWRILDDNIAPATTCTYHQGTLVLEKSSWRDDGGGCGILVYSGENGRLLWQKDYKPGMTHFKEARAFFARGLVWLQMDKSKIAGFDPLTGTQQQIYGSRGGHCSSPVASERFFMAAECEFTDLASGKQSRARMFKSACRLPFIPANGLLYSFPVQCECYPMLRGYMGLTSTAPPKPPSTPRLIQGPAFDRPPQPLLGSDLASAWPMYRHDLFRSGSTPVTLNSNESKRAWTTRVTQTSTAPLAAEWQDDPFVRGPITAPVAAGGQVFVAVPDEHRVAALDAKTGQTRWSFSAGARIDTPPTIHDNLCLFGVHDGWVYCLDAAHGQLAWKFRAARADTRITAYGQMESLWPVPGSVLVDHDIVYGVAGRHPMADGGISFFALKARTGELVWEKTLKELVLTNWYGMALPNKKKVGLDFEPLDLLVRDGDGLAMSRWRINPQSGDFRLALASAEYQTPTLAVPRGLWGYGIRQNKSVEHKLPVVFDESKIWAGTTNDAALVLAGGTLVRCSTHGLLTIGTNIAQLTTLPVHDGLIAAYGRLYVSTRDGEVICFE